MNIASQQNPNLELQLAHDFIEYTGQHLFLTGKAGTGKTTFLHNLSKQCAKRMIITAPTGVAAINAGGVTLHSFFQLPFAPYIPGSEISNQHRLNKEKINIIRSLNLLVIDEISMVRADLLDLIDTVLRKVRRNPKPFGGLQLLMIGDLHQLSPVVKEEDWTILQEHYDCAYFFSAKALQESNWVTIELQQVYRQSDPKFINLLNQVRNNKLDNIARELLQSRYQPNFRGDDHQRYITLTTHNRNADNINNRELAVLKNPIYTYEATISGDYPEYSYPAAVKLVLKKGAQVMFVRNEPTVEKRYYNGKTGIITNLDEESITVHCSDDNQEITVAATTWDNIKYSLDENTQQIREEITGSFTQMPLRLAWAITIHKSQGLTFERAIIDGHAAFSPGQIYVALSRCKSLAGVVLSTPINTNAILTDEVVAKFTKTSQQNPPDRQQLNLAKIIYQQRLLLECFDYKNLARSFNIFVAKLGENQKLLYANRIDEISTIKKQVFAEVITVSDKFMLQLKSLFQNEVLPQDDEKIQERVRKACSYFSDKLQATLINWINNFTFSTDNKAVKKQIDNAQQALQQELNIKQAALGICADGFDSTKYLNAIAHAQIESNSKAKIKDKKPEVELSMADLEHPQLFKLLKEWRNEEAKREDVAHFRIMHQRVLLQIAKSLPANKNALLQINGIGNALANKYAEAIINIVTNYCISQQITANEDISELPTSKSSSPNLANLPSIKNTKQISYDLYSQGLSIAQIAEKRGLVISTIEFHLSHYVKTKQVDINQLISPDKIDKIKAEIAKNGGDSLKVLKDALGDGYSYGELRLVVASVE